MSCLVKDQLIHELKSMVLFCSGRGMSIPSDVLVFLNKLSHLEANQDVGNVDLSEEDWLMLSHCHYLIADQVHPAKPETIALVQKNQDGWFGFLGPVDIIRHFSILTLLFMGGFIGLALSNTITVESLNLGIFDNSGLELLLSLTFLICCAGLGGSFNGFYQLFRYINTMTYEPKYDVTYWIRLLMGIMSGLILCEVIPLNQHLSNSGFEQLDKPLVAMLGGFSSGLLYKILHSWLGVIEKALLGSSSSEPTTEPKREAKAVERK